LKDLKEYIESGILEEYCLGLLNEEDQAYLIQMTMLYPEIKAELTAIELAMERWAESTAMEPPAGLKERVLNQLGFDDSFIPLSLQQLPAIDKHADHQAWLNAAAHLAANEPLEDFVCHVLRDDDRIRQMLVITKIDVPEEDHDNLLESFFILKGHCECTVGDDFFRLGPGDFLEIPLHVKHNIKVTSPYIVAVLQYEFV
jgi:mannose-6-phosphate isomerase-like protein (cupin superfamily)